MTKATDVDRMIADLCKKHGEEAVMRMNMPAKGGIPVLSSGSYGLNRALGVGGYPRGRVIEIYGPESAGKTTVALHAIAEAQKDGGLAAFIDAEHALDLGYAKALGVDTADLLLSQPDNGEMALNLCEDLVESGKIDVIVIDSVAALTPKAEIEGDVGQHFVGVQARMMSQALRKLVGIANGTQTIIIFINQLRSKIGVMYGSPEVTTGGNALKFYASVRLDVRRREQVKDGEQNAVGNQTVIKVIKNKVAPPFQEANVDIIWGQGIDRMGDLLQEAISNNIVEKAGAWYSYKDHRLGQGFFNAAKTLKENSGWLSEIEAALRARLVGG